ncbi:KR domain-containing protein [Streptacidiphilus sp. 4-A2]|nr:KR domain-containing protein [Streptacidiphilus sp. 4-A2]
MAGRTRRRAAGAHQPIRSLRGRCRSAGRRAGRGGHDRAGAGGDVGRRTDLAGLLSRIAATGAPLTTVMHTAGVVDNGVLDRLDPDRLASVLAAKATSAALLDELTAELELDGVRAVLLGRRDLRRRRAGQLRGATPTWTRWRSTAAARRTALSIAWGPWAGAAWPSPARPPWPGWTQPLEVLMDPRWRCRPWPRPSRAATPP